MAEGTKSGLYSNTRWFDRNASIEVASETKTVPSPATATDLGWDAVEREVDLGKSTLTPLLVGANKKNLRKQGRYDAQCVILDVVYLDLMYAIIPSDGENMMVFRIGGHARHEIGMARARDMFRFTGLR